MLELDLELVSRPSTNLLLLCRERSSSLLQEKIRAKNADLKGEAIPKFLSLKK